MKIDLYMLCWNESDILPFVLKHYKKFVDEIFIYDNYSDDGSQQIAESFGAKVIPFGQPGVLDDGEYLKIKNHCWKRSEADYVIVCDADEVLCLPGENIYQMLARLKFEERTIIKTKGWDIVSRSMPKNDLSEITTGYEFNNYSKLICFSPKHIQEINYDFGAHRLKQPVGNIIFSEETLTLMHYSWIGGPDRIIKKYKEYKKRLSKFNRKNGHGIHYLKSGGQIRQEFEEKLNICKPLWQD